MTIQAGWRSIANWRKDRAFIDAMKAEANGAAVWASWLPGAIKGGPRNLRLNLPLLRDQANGAATWARWPAGTPQPPRNDSTLRLNAVAALEAGFQ